jgi:hypothetical protein
MSHAPTPFIFGAPQPSSIWGTPPIWQPPIVQQTQQPTPEQYAKAIAFFVNLFNGIFARNIVSIKTVEYLYKYDVVKTHTRFIDLCHKVLSASNYPSGGEMIKPAVIEFINMLEEPNNQSLVLVAMKFI